nr:hypothetical protein Iba_chr10eCG15390 [Ipomoea batatas]
MTTNIAKDPKVLATTMFRPNEAITRKRPIDIWCKERYKRNCLRHLKWLNEGNQFSSKLRTDERTWNRSSDKNDWKLGYYHRNLQKAIEENHKNCKVKSTEIDSSIFQTIVMHCGPKEHTHHDQNDQKKLENNQFSVRTIKISLARVNRIKRGKGSAWVNLKTRTNAFRFSSSICHWKPIFRSSARFTPYVLADKAAGKKPETPNPDLLQKISNIFSRRASKTHKQEEIKSTFARSLIHNLPFTKQNHVIEQASSYQGQSKSHPLTKPSRFPLAIHLQRVFSKLQQPKQPKISAKKAGKNLLQKDMMQQQLTMLKAIPLTKSRELHCLPYCHLCNVPIALADICRRSLRHKLIQIVPIAGGHAMARRGKQAATPWAKEARGCRWAATPMSEEIGGWPCHEGGHAMAKRGQRAVSPWSKEVGRAPLHGRRRLAGGQAMVVVDWLAATPWLEDVARQVATPWPKEVIGRR